ncbi:MAG: SRPBCC domain-containing protein [Pseudomonadales bacterium]
MKDQEASGNSRDGILTRDANGCPIMRFERNLKHSFEAVWNAITDPDEVSGWRRFEVQIDPRVGGKISMGDTGEITKFEPPYLLEYIAAIQPEPPS